MRAMRGQLLPLDRQVAARSLGHLGEYDGRRRRAQAAAFAVATRPEDLQGKQHRRGNQQAGPQRIDR